MLRTELRARRRRRMKLALSLNVTLPKILGISLMHHWFSVAWERVISGKLISLFLSLISLRTNFSAFFSKLLSNWALFSHENVRFLRVLSYSQSRIIETEGSSFCWLIWSSGINFLPSYSTRTNSFQCLFVSILCSLL